MLPSHAPLSLCPLVEKCNKRLSEEALTIQLTADSPHTCVRKCSLTAVSSALASCVTLPPPSMGSCAFPPRLRAPTVGGLEQISGNLNRYEPIYNCVE